MLTSLKLLEELLINEKGLKLMMKLIGFTLLYFLQQTIMANSLKEKNQKPRFLFVVDCDETITAKDTGTSMFNLFKTKQTKEKIWDRYNMHQDWPQLMQEGFDALCKEGVLPEEIMKGQREIPVIKGMVKFLRTVGNRGDCQVVISSDSNIMFINSILQKHKLEKCVSTIYSNPVERDPQNNGRLVYQPHHKSHPCQTCPKNMCKREVLRKLLDTQTTKGITYDRIFVVGDGENDHCQCVLLRSQDYIMPRVGFPLHDIVSEMKKVKNSPSPGVLPWIDGDQTLSLALNAINETAGSI